MVLHGLRSNGRLGIENDADPAATALRAHHAVLEVRDRHLAAPRPDQRLKVQLLRVVALPSRMRLVDSAVDAFAWTRQPAVIASPRVSMGMRTTREH
jgi:hypothetical protein